MSLWKYRFGSREHLNRRKPCPSVSPISFGYPAEGQLSQTCWPSNFCCAEIGFRFLLGHSSRTPLRHVNDQEDDSDHE